MPGDARSARAWRLIVGAIAGLVLGIALASSGAIAITFVVGEVAQRALEHDVSLEDEGDDVLATVLDVRHYHRNLFFAGPSSDRVEDFDSALAALYEELGELDDIVIMSADLSTAQELRAMVEAYEAAYRPAIELYDIDRAAFDEASDHGLEHLADIQTEAVKLEERGEELAEAAFRSINETTTTATIILVAVLVGVGAAGIALSLAAVRVLRQQRDLYAAQRESAAQLELALRTRTDFIADASHELRTPLTVLRGNAEVGLAASSPGCGHEPVLREIVAESARMTRLVEDLLFLARYDAGALPLEERVIEIEPWLAEVAARAEVLARQRGARLDVLDGGVRSRGHGCGACPAGDPRAHRQCREVQPARRVGGDVGDRGGRVAADRRGGPRPGHPRGRPPEHLRAVLPCRPDARPSQRWGGPRPLDRSRDRRCARRAHRGVRPPRRWDSDAHRDPDPRGRPCRRTANRSRRARDPPRPAGDVAAAERASTTHATGLMARVLIIEDDAPIAALLERGLRLAGYEVTVEDDSLGGRRRWIEGGHDAIILDLMLPGANGLELCAERRRAGDRHAGPAPHCERRPPRAPPGDGPPGRQP